MRDQRSAEVQLLLDLDAGGFERLNAETVKALASPDVRDRFAALGVEPVGNSPSEFAAMQKAETSRWAKLAKEANLRLD